MWSSKAAGSSWSGLLEYRALHRLLEGDWRPRALEVQTLARELAGREAEVRTLEERARRATHDAALLPAQRLADAVSAARLALCKVLRTSPSGLTRALRQLEESADEPAAVGRAERQLWTAAALLGAATPALLPRLSASRGGPVMFALLGLVDEPLAAAGLLDTCVLAFVLHLRRTSWSWLSPSAQSWGLTGLLGGARLLSGGARPRRARVVAAGGARPDGRHPDPLPRGGEGEIRRSARASSRSAREACRPARARAPSPG